MTDERIKRINELAKKARESFLTDAEKQEQANLRAEYIAAFRGSLKNQLDNVIIVDKDGTQTPLKKKD